MKMLFFSIEVNAILWLVVVGILLENPSDLGSAKVFALFGLVVAAVTQHWAYYNIRKKKS